MPNDKVQESVYRQTNYVRSEKEEKERETVVFGGDMITAYKSYTGVYVDASKFVYTYTTEVRNARKETCLSRAAILRPGNAPKPFAFLVSRRPGLLTLKCWYTHGQCTVFED